jgi:hypothetical protein
MQHSRGSPWQLFSVCSMEPGGPLPEGRWQDGGSVVHPTYAGEPCGTIGVGALSLWNNEMYSKIFTELAAIVGYKKRRWIQEPTPGGWRCGHMLSGMATPVSRVWRFTPADGKPHAHVSEGGGNVKLTTRHGDGSQVTIVFSEATLVVAPLPGTPSVSTVGVWINQSFVATNEHKRMSTKQLHPNQHS